MVFISTPETTSRVSLTKARMFLKHPAGRPGLQHYLRIKNGVLLRNIDLKMDMGPSKSECSELEAERFEFPKSKSASVNMRLLTKTVKPAFRHKHQSNPIIPRVWRRKTETLITFKAHATFNHFSYSRALPNAGLCPARALVNEWKVLREKYCANSTAGHRCCSDPASILGDCINSFTFLEIF